jgi:arabinogalactan endo-1,4-beta-galactosidase
MLAVSAVSLPAAAGEARDLPIGADLSHVPFLRASGAVWRDGGVAGDPLHQFADNGWSIVRLRLWHSPDTSSWKRYHGLDSTVAFAKEVVAAGHRLMLDFHYSDTWADPGHQEPPAAWQGLDVRFLADSLYFYTRAVLERFRAEGAMPDYVQLGNEIDPGMLWPAGYVGGDDPQKWDNLARLLNAGELAVRHAADGTATPQVVLHIASSGDPEHARSWIDSLRVRGVSFDLLGLSFYPWWHGTLGELTATMRDVAYRFGLPMMIVETSYPFTLEGYPDGVHNFVGSEEKLHAGFPATPEGQAAFHDSLVSVVRSVPGGLGRGVLWWEPAWVPVQARGVPIENLSLYGYDGNALPGLDQRTVSGAEGGGAARPPSLSVHAWPNPFNGSVTVEWSGMGGEPAQLELFGPLGRRAGRWRVQGPGRLRVDTGALASGLYLLRVSGSGQAVTRRITLLR